MRLLKTPRFRAYLGLAILAGGMGGLALSGDLLAHIGRFTAFYVLAGAGFALLATAATSLPLRGALVAAVLLRLILLPMTPSLSDDYHRYVWDGRVQLAGVNPYKHRPFDDALDDVRSVGRDRVNHPELRTIYPPLTQAVFAGVAVVSRILGQDDAMTPGTEVVLFKLVFGAFDLATAGAVWLLAAARLRRRAIVLYLLCPAVILPTWESAHAEAAAVFFCVLAAAQLVRRRDAWAGVALGIAAALKVTPLALLVPALLGGRASPARLLAGFLPAFLIPYLPYVLTGGAFGSLFESGSTWTGGSLLFRLLGAATTPEAARWLALAVFAGGALWIARRLRGRDRTAEAFAWTFTLLVLCLPVVHAWYWLAPLALGLAAGLWLPLLIGMLAPPVEYLPHAVSAVRAQAMSEAYWVLPAGRAPRDRVVDGAGGRHTGTMTKATR
jgi:hypothetical protein